MNSFIVLLCVVAITGASASPQYLAAPAAPLVHGPALLAPAPLAAPALLAPAPILTAPAVVGHAPVLLGHSPVATTTHIGAPIGARTFSAPVATYSTTHTLLGAPLAAPALLARPALPLAAPAFAAPAFAAPFPAPLAAPLAPLAAGPLALPALAAPGVLARPALW